MQQGQEDNSIYLKEFSFYLTAIIVKTDVDMHKRELL